MDPELPSKVSRPTFPRNGGRWVERLTARGWRIGRRRARLLVGPSLILATVIAPPVSAQPRADAWTVKEARAARDSNEIDLGMRRVLDNRDASRARLGSVADGSAPQSRTKGLVLGLDLGGAAASFDNTPRDGAGLVGARIGYGFNRILTLYLSAYEADVDVRGFDGFDKVTFGHVDLEMRLHLANSRRRWVPYGDLTITFWPVSDVLKNGEQTTTDFKGLPTSSLGGGLAIYLSETLALDVNFKAARGLFKDIPVGNILDEEHEQHAHTFLDLGAKSARFTVGVSWWP